MKDEIAAFIAETLEVDKKELKDNVSLSDGIGVDSTEMVELNLALQKRFGIKLEPGQVNKNSTLDDIVRVIQSKKFLK